MTNQRIAHDRALRRHADIKQYIQAIRQHLSDRTIDQVREDLPARAAFERFLEIVSEASRAVPDSWKAEHADIPWRRVADIGNLLRHGYRQVALEPLWEIYARDLDPLERAVDAMLAAHPPMEESL